MSRSTDPGHFFQTTSALNEAARKACKAQNDKGRPTKLPSKLLAVASVGGDEGAVYVAEAAGCVKRILLETGDVTATFSGPTAPLTSLAVSSTSHTVFAGCWDKTLWSWDTSTRKPGIRFTGHADFVKAVLVFTLQGRELLVSGSADATLIVWDAATGSNLHTLKGHTRGILALVLDPVEYDPAKASTTVFSAGSDREIRRWKVGWNEAAEIQDSNSPIIAHETNVDALHFDADGDLWTASFDKTAKCLSRAHNWEEDTSLEHPDYVRDVAVDEEGAWVVTACRDEQVRVWDRGGGKLKHVFEGHFEEVMALVVVEKQKVVSVGIDGTVRQWSLKAAELAKAIQEAENERAGKVKEEVTGKTALMTEEEEAELAALMEDSE